LPWRVFAVFDGYQSDNPQTDKGVNMRNKGVFAGLAAVVAALGIVSPAAADSRVYSVGPLQGAPYVLYDRSEGLFYRAPPYYWSRYYGLDPYAWHYRNAGRYGQPYDLSQQNRFRPRISRYVPPSAAIYHVPQRAAPKAQESAPKESVPKESVPKAPAPPEQKLPDIDL
jgi:hypothetical protein